MITEFSLFVFTTVGGLSAGMYATAALFQAKSKDLVASVLPLVLLAIGGVALLLHLGHPERLLNAFSNPQAGITQEAIASIIFGGVLIIDALLTLVKGSTPRLLRWFGGIAAVILSSVMGLAYFGYESMPAWHAIPTIPLFLLGNLAMGALLWGALNDELYQKKSFVVISIMAAALTAVVFAAERELFAQLGYSMVAPAVAIAFAVVAFVLAAVKRMTMNRLSNQREQQIGSALSWAAFICIFAGVIIARYAFYAIY